MGAPADGIVMVGVPAAELDLCRAALRQQQHMAVAYAQTARDRQERIEALEREIAGRSRKPNWPALWAGTLAAMSIIGNAVLLVRLWGA